MSLFQFHLHVSQRAFNEADALRVVQEALKRGVNYIDTAAYYGQDRSSERILGKVGVMYYNLTAIKKISYFLLCVLWNKKIF